MEDGAARRTIDRSTRFRGRRLLFSSHQDHPRGILRVARGSRPIPGLDFPCLPVCTDPLTTFSVSRPFARRSGVLPTHSPRAPALNLHHKRQGFAATIYHSVKIFLAWCGLIEKEHPFVNTNDRKNMLPGSCKMHRIALEAARDTNSSLYEAGHGILERG